MARSFNQVIIIGNLTRDPELRTIPSGQSVASFAVATNRVWQNQDGESQEQADFHNVVAWAKLGENVNQYLHKGSKVMVVGRLQTRSWEGEDGKKNYRTEIVANDINFLDRPGGSSDEDSFGGAGVVNDTSSSSSGSDSAAKPAKKPAKAADASRRDEKIEIEDLDEDVDLSQIPF